MGLETTNPLYADHVDDWTMMRDLYKGERAVKEKGVTYLPATAGMELDGMTEGAVGKKAYDAYKLRAVFHDYVREGIEALIGLLHQMPATVELPAVLEPLRERATVSGENLDLLLRRINVEQLTTGRLGLLVDLPVTPDPANPLPYIALYAAESVHNWDDSAAIGGFKALNVVVLNESGAVMNSDFVWEEKTKYRVLQLGQIAEGSGAGTNAYLQGTFEDATYNPVNMIAPNIRGTTLEQIPFVFVNSKDLIATPDEPPLIGLGQLALAIYRGEADYRQNLYMQGQDTLVVIGGTRNANGVPGQDDDAIRTGAGSRIDLEINGDAKYIGVGAEGLTEQRSALENDKKRAETKAGQLITGSATQVESGQALHTRMGAQTATLNQLAIAGAAGLETALKAAAVWMGANPDEVKVTPNLEFADFELNGQEIVHLMSARTMGAPLSLESVHALMVERGITKLDFETEMGKVEEEMANMPAGTGTGVGGNPPGGEQDDGQKQ